MQPSSLWILSLATAVIALVLLAGSMFWRSWRLNKLQSRLQFLGKDVKRRSAVVLPTAVHAVQETTEVLHENEWHTPAWLESKWAQALLAEEDKNLLDQAGFAKEKAPVFYVAGRISLALFFLLIGLFFVDGQSIQKIGITFVLMGLGLMLPKWFVRSKAKQRRQQVGVELPLFVDMLRLLQGIGMSVDQSLHILAKDFSSVLQVIGAELDIANRLYASGRTREQSFQRLIKMSANEDMAAVVSLMVQVDKHGGAVQEPLSQFATRLREKRQAAFKEKIGTITVKMTAVMVLTLLPALIVITAGPGFMAVMRSMARV